MNDLDDKVFSEQASVLSEIEEISCFAANEIDAITPGDFELRDLAVLRDIRKKLDEIKSRIEKYYDGQ